MNIPQEKLDEIKDSVGFSDEQNEEEPMIPDSPKVEEKVSASTEEEDAVADKARIPYSRFETVNEAKIRAEERARILEEQLAEFKQQKTDSDKDISIPDDWIELYGDSDTAKRAYALHMRSLERIREETEAKVLDVIEKRQSEKQSEFESNLEYIEEGLAKFEESLGRKLTEAEENSVLDIQDEFTPKDERGNYIAPLLSPEKAFEIYTLRQGNAQAKTAIARRKVVSITGSSSEGEGSNSAFDNYKPGVSGLWRDKL